MPNAKILSEKQAIVASLTEKFQNAAAGVIVDYCGITDRTAYAVGSKKLSCHFFSILSSNAQRACCKTRIF